MSERLDFAEFYRAAKDECLFTVLVSVGDRDLAEELVAEAFARAWASWRTVSGHPAPRAWVVRTALNANVSRWRRRRREVPMPDLDTDRTAGMLGIAPGTVQAHLGRAIAALRDDLMPERQQESRS